MRHPVLEKILNILNSVEKLDFHKIEYKLLDIKKLNKGIDEIKTIKVNDKKLILFSIKNNMEDFLEKNENFVNEIFNFIYYIEKNEDEIENIIEELDFFDENEIDRLLFIFSKEKIDKEVLDLFLIGCSYPLEINKAKSSQFSFCLDFCKRKNIKKETELLQYKKVINILNEYYNTNDLLWKFLLLYHILENFADRLILRENIVDKNIENIDKLSFIFKAFNDKNKEIDLLKNLFSNFNGEINSIKMEDIDLLQKLYEFIELDRNSIKNAQNKITPNKLVLIIYDLRNSIVHNKEKEWIHIDNSLLIEKEELREAIEKVLLPFMEEIIKKIIYEKKILDYKMDKNYILLWGDEPITEENNNETT